ncbi:MAG TPA: MaoC/PaaZ C-terminal domain-containing protein [Burkholderiales bacterium]|jgi:3-hydroxybutyryl-CoA dehydratase|nr:MaoC/PaaZ C-terminal domain-containing protein [Burkholderiales bacterium]
MTNPRKAAPITEGEVFYGPSKTLTDAHFLMFSAVTGDVHPIHYDAEYAKQTRFGKPLAHGLLLASLTALGASSGRERCDGYVLVEQGSRFLHPAAVGDTVTPELVVERIWREGKRVMCRVQTKLTNQSGETLLEGFHVYRVLEENAAKEKK